MAAKPQDNALVVCPHCGHQQPEARAAISSNCRQCGQYLRVQELLHPVVKAVAPALELRHFTCFDCGAELDVPVAAQSAMCKRCSSYLDLNDYTINNAVSKNFRTKGRFVVETKGYVFNTTVVAREIVIKGQVIGKLTAEESLTLYSTAEIKGSFQTKRLIIPAGNVFHAKELLRVGAVEIAGELVGSVLAENTVTVRATGQLFGDVQARHLIVEAGAILGRSRADWPRALTASSAKRTRHCLASGPSLLNRRQYLRHHFAFRLRTLRSFAVQAHAYLAGIHVPPPMTSMVWTLAFSASAILALMGSGLKPASARTSWARSSQRISLA